MPRRRLRVDLTYAQLTRLQRQHTRTSRKAELRAGGEVVGEIIWRHSAGEGWQRPQPEVIITNRALLERHRGKKGVPHTQGNRVGVLVEAHTADGKPFRFFIPEEKG